MSPAICAIFRNDALNLREWIEQRYQEGCIQGDMKDFLPWLREHARGTVFEIGVRDGVSTSALLLGVEKNGGIVLSVDIHDCSHLFPGHPLWKFIRSDSHDPGLQIPAIDIALIDGDHTRGGYRADLERVFPLVKSGGLILSHDIAPEPGQTLEDVPDSEYPSVAVKEEYFRFCEEKGLSHFELPGMYGMGVIVKP
jgi:predicted O-methyltransferase YrrM